MLSALLRLLFQAREHHANMNTRSSSCEMALAMLAFAGMAIEA